MSSETAPGASPHDPLVPLREPLDVPDGYPPRPVDPRDDAALQRRVEGLMHATGALQSGHFLLKSGRHGDRYLEKWALLQHPEAAAEVCRALAVRVVERLEGLGTEVDLVAGPTTGGVLLAYELGRLLGVRVIFAEETSGSDAVPRRIFRRGFVVPPRSRVLLVDDIFTTGSSLVALLAPLYAAGAHPVAAAVVASRTPDAATVQSPGREPIPLIAAAALDLPTYEPGRCPLCAAGVPIGAPGSAGR